MTLESKQRTGQFMINEEIKQITYLDLRFYTPDNGQTFFPSVTTILDAYPKTAAFYEWLKKNGDESDSIRDAAAERGSIVHQLTESYDNGEVVSLIDLDGRIRYKATEWGMFEKYVEFTKYAEPVIEQNEVNIISPTLRTAGTLDRRVKFPKYFGDKRFILDIKTSNAVHPHYFLQLSAYVKLNNEAFPNEQADGVCILWLNAKTRGEGKTKGAIQGKGWQLVFPDRELDHYWKLFQHTQALWEEVNGDMKPKNLIYTLEHKK